MGFFLSLSVCLSSTGKERLSGILGVSAEEASRFQDRFLQKYKEVQAFIQCTVQHCHKYGACRCVISLLYIITYEYQDRMDGMPRGIFAKECRWRI